MKQIFPSQAQKSTATIASNIDDAGHIRGNANSHIFHWPGCPSYDKVSPKNRVEFSSVHEAEAAGYRLAGNCR
ncbi:sunset domain-containing protein [Stutzerimonas nitrititolerans]|jgi:methylphosphotriester-DNA--protein-cysteine methyltransferase|uniref:sunset domain-containing protein n=1 Tax=Stutzerimonas nitrititolerans TaxID=2482751 RepID=UPI0035E3F286